MTPAQRELIETIWKCRDIEVTCDCHTCRTRRHREALEAIHEYNKRWLADHADNLRSLIDGNTEDSLGATLQPIVESMEHLTGIKPI